MARMWLFLGESWFAQTIVFWFLVGGAIWMVEFALDMLSWRQKPALENPQSHPPIQVKKNGVLLARSLPEIEDFQHQLLSFQKTSWKNDRINAKPLGSDSKMSPPGEAWAWQGLPTGGSSGPRARRCVAIVGDPQLHHVSCRFGGFLMVLWIFWGIKMIWG